MKIGNTNTAISKRVIALVFGESGNGKTTLAATLKTLGKVLIVSAEGGLLSLAGQDIDVIDITTDDNGETIKESKRIQRLVEVYQFLKTEEAKSKYDFIFIDSLTEINQNLMAALLEEFPERKDSLVMYGENSKRMRGLIKSFRDLQDYSVIFTALSSIDKDENGIRYKGIDCIGKIANSMPAFFDEVFYLGIFENKEGEQTRALVTGGSDQIVCKDRSGKLGKIEKADLGFVINKIREEE